MDDCPVSEHNILIQQLPSDFCLPIVSCLSSSRLISFPCPQHGVVRTSSNSSKASIGRALAYRIGRSIRQAFTAWRGRQSSGTIDTDALAQHLMRQFGEYVNRHELPVPSQQNQRKLEQAKLKVGEDSTRDVMGWLQCFDTACGVYS